MASSLLNMTSTISLNYQSMPFEALSLDVWLGRLKWAHLWVLTPIIFGELVWAIFKRGGHPSWGSLRNIIDAQFSLIPKKLGGNFWPQGPKWVRLQLVSSCRLNIVKCDCRSQLFNSEIDLCQCCQPHFSLRLTTWTKWLPSVGQRVLGLEISRAVCT